MRRQSRHRARTHPGLRAAAAPAALAMLAMLLTQAGCQPDPPYLRTRTVDLPEPVRIQPRIVEHMKEHVAYRGQFREYWHYFEADHYTLTLSDGRRLEIFIRDDNPHVVLRDAAGGNPTPLGIWSPWSRPIRGPHLRFGPSATTRPEVTP